ncbi:hypothetical protein MED121_00595 [Marinomonas sp. MED121]|uniref:aspartate/glutamate racemase family protein n=1 Tax=Marinomonas sp. MED121 TaxID=314277 RepID=UPI0000690578|nr:aspartate/glutamate racemase family protein [Marinomonas sp. MED121]EAQ63661.1 hypothetical protein MED121_00595 [Marinomonas sp. MED121]
MKTIGLIGGMSWESSATYYREINQTVKQELGGLHSAKICLMSVDFAEIALCQEKGDWDKAAKILTNAAKSLEKAGVDFILIGTNTMHKVANQIKANINVPLLHIAHATGERLIADKIEKVALLGTAFTMEQAFYKDTLSKAFGLEVLVPQAGDAQIIHNIIYQELCLGKCLEESKKAYLDIISRLVEEGAQGVILGCTEIGLLIQQSDLNIPVYDTCLIHAKAAVTLALE